MKFITKKGLWVSSSFTKKFGTDEITPAKTIPQFKKIERSMTDSEIKNEFAMEECTLEDIAAFLKKPPEGTDDGYWNIFYVAGCVVFVFWLSGNRMWFVGTWNLDGVFWDAGDRAFGCNWHSESLNSSDTLTLSSLALRVEKLEAVIKHHNLRAST